VIYTASSLALALLEILVHVSIEQIPDDYVWLKAEFSESFIQYPREIPADTAVFGSEWLHTRGGKVILAVPSVIVPEPNYLMNPDHMDFINIAWGEPEPLQIDPRLTRAEKIPSAWQQRAIGEISH